MVALCRRRDTHCNGAGESPNCSPRWSPQRQPIVRQSTEDDLLRTFTGIVVGSLTFSSLPTATDLLRRGRTPDDGNRLYLVPE